MDSARYAMLRQDMPAHSTGARTLLVQPEHDDRQTYARALGSLGFSPVSASAAIDALAIAPRVDIVVTDILLSGYLDGVEFVTRLKTDAQTKRTPVIVLTGCTWESERERAHAAGCDVFLAKPCLLDDLVGEIHRLLTLYRLPKPPARSALPPVRHTPLAS